ncbi:hypothetical protein GN958_ATG20365 [Phytophthora infestans]|uniref:Uncharacterized protein n=1 Tax=Phytophthora infestans TaxID=4787 RepID=A0A8S9TPI4_PHYIN|nr:hypothetical protein GN958_ATG20365 [Phytophthora infestans]
MQIDDEKQTTRAWEENERDEAPYAYAGGPQSDSLATTTPPRAADFNQSARSASAAQEDEVMPLATTGGATTAAAARATEQHSQSRLEITTTSAVVRSARKVKQLSGKIGLQDGAIKGMQNSMATYIKSTKRAVEGKTGEVITAVVSKPTQSGDGHEQEDIVPATPTSQEDLTIGITRMGTYEGDADLPVQLGQWLVRFNGTEVEVEANGQWSMRLPCIIRINHESFNVKTQKLKGNGPTGHRVEAVNLRAHDDEFTQ